MADLVLVTGANGFIGSALCLRLRDEGMSVRRGVRNPLLFPAGGRPKGGDLECVVLHDLVTEAGTREALRGVQVVIHLAARVHVMEERAADPLREFLRVNRDWTERLARVAAEQGVRRFVYLSSIKVNGEKSVEPFTERDVPNPQDLYGLSKWEGEQALARVSSGTGLEIVIVRSPLVYGPGVRGNFLHLLKVLWRGVPLPLGLVENRRSLVYLGNLVDALACCAKDPRAAGRTYLISDGEDLSTPDLIRRIGRAMNRSVRLWPVPVPVLHLMGSLAGRMSLIERLTNTLQVDSSGLRADLSWSPPWPVDRGLEETVAWFVSQQAGSLA